MARKISMVAPEWWDFTTLDEKILQDAARLSPHDLLQLSRPGFLVVLLYFKFTKSSKPKALIIYIICFCNYPFVNKYQVIKRTILVLGHETCNVG
jgi:uncharacterized protein YybS (DUF2232 family)